MRFAAAILSGLALCAGPAVAEEPQAPFSKGVLERDFRQMMAWFPGEWDNSEQVNFAAELGYPEGATPGRLHSSIHAVDVPALGPNVFYLQQYRDNDPEALGRQRFYAVAIDEASMAIRMDIYTPRDPARFLNAHLEPDKLAGLTRADLTSNPGCEILWRRQAEQFIGWIGENACRIRSRTSAMLTISGDLLLSADQFWASEGVTDDQGGTPFGPVPVPHQMRRAQAFTCWMAVPRLAPAEGWFYARDLKIHDQGGEVWITTDETTPRSFGFRMRNVRWPSGPNADALTLYVHTREQTAAISYAWASPDADRVGINLRTLQGSCSR